MPRNRAVDYPQIHPPTTQPSHGLAPPQNHAGSNRFSWQGAPSQVAERQLEGGNVDNPQELEQSKVPPLPVLPHDLRGSEQPEQEYGNHSQTQAAYPVQVNHQLPYQSQTQSLQYQYQQLQQQQLIQQHVRQQYLQQQYLQQQEQEQEERRRIQAQSQYTGPPVSYEASQAAHQTYPAQPDQSVHSGHHNAPQAQFSATAKPQKDEHQSSDVKDTNHEVLPQQPAAIHIAPDANPLAVTSPTRPAIVTNQPSTTLTSYPPANRTPIEYPQPNSFSPSTGPIRGGTWHYTLGSCAEPATCLSSLFCPCIVYGRTQYRLGLKSAQKDPTNMLGYSAINGSCIAWSVLCGFNMLLTAVQHRRVRKGYDMEEIAGSTGSDCIKSACCCCCIIAQDEKEVRFREEKGRKGEANMAERGYQSPVGMNFSAPPR